MSSIWTPSTSGGSSWTNALTMDFRSYNVNLTGDGNKVIGGLTFKKENSGADATPMVCTPGAGVVIVPSTPTYYGGGTRSSPLLWLSLDQILPSTVDWDTGLRVYAYIPTMTGAANDYDQAIVGIDTDSNKIEASSIRAAVTAGAAKYASCAFTVNGALTGADTVLSAFDATNSCQMVEVDALAPAVVRAYFGPGSSGTPFPAVSAMRAAGVITKSGGYSGDLLGGITGNPRTSLGVVLSAMRGDTGAAMTVTIAGLRVDYKLS